MSLGTGPLTRRRIVRAGLQAAALAAIAALTAPLWLGGAPVERWQGPLAQVYTVPDDRRDTVTATLVFPADPAAEPGLLHYAEHLAWLSAVGQAARGPDRHSNAWTSETAVAYWLSGAPGDLSEILGTLFGVFDPIALPDGFAEEERGIVLREYELRLGGNPDGQAARAMDAFLYAGNALALPVLGTPEAIRAFDPAAARALHAATHRPDAATLVVAGDVTAREVRRAIDAFDLAAPGASPAAIAPPPFTLAAPGAARFRFPDPAAAPRLVWRRVVRLDAPVAFDLLEARTALLTDVLNSTRPGGIAGPLRFDAAVARGFEIDVWPIDESHAEMRFAATPDRGVSLDALADAFETVLSGLAASGVPRDTYDGVRARFDRLWPDWDDPDEVADWRAVYVADRVAELRVPLSEAEIRTLPEAIVPDDIDALLRLFGGPGRTAIAHIGAAEGEG